MSVASKIIPESSTFDWLMLDQLHGAPLRAAVEYWNQLRAERAFPAREALKPREMAGILPYMSLLKVIDGGADFEHRIVGDVIVRAFDVPIQNRRFSEIAYDAPDLIAISRIVFGKVVESRAPLAWRQRTGHDTSHIVFTEAEMVLLPLGQCDDRVDHVAAFGVHASQTSPAG